MNMQVSGGDQAKTWGKQIIGFTRRQGIDARIASAVRSSQCLTYCLELREPAQLSKLLTYDDALALALGVESVRVGRSRGHVLVEAALPVAMFQALALGALPVGRGAAVALGKSVLAQPVSMDLAGDMTPHVLVAGTTGSGKSVLLQVIVAQLARQNTPGRLRLLLIDGKAEALRPFGRLPHLVHPVIVDPAEAVKALAWAVAELDRRKTQPQGWKLVIVVDEIAEIVATTGGKDGAAAQAFQRLCALGRSLGVHVVMATQYPTGDVLGGSLAKANLPMRLAGRVVDANASTLATGQAGMGAHKLRGRGDFLAVTGADVQRLQVAQPSARDIEGLPGADLVASLDLGEVTPDGALAATANQQPDPLTAKQVAWVLSQSVAGVPGQHRIKNALGIGSAKAVRLQQFCGDLLTELDAHGCEVLCPAEDDETGESEEQNG